MAKIIISEELKEVLLKINNPISNLILNGDIDNDIINNEKQINYLDISKSNIEHISYLNKDRKEKIDQVGGNYWEPKLRFYSKPGSVINKMLIKSDPQEIEKFSNDYISIVNPPIFTMKIVKGDDIPHYYNYNSYKEQKGTLGNSCMKDKNSNFFELYSKNPDNINMLIMVDQNNKIYGRSILWIGEDFKLMDRIYTIYDKYYFYFYEWAKNNGYYYKTYNNYMNPLNIMIDGNDSIKKLEIKLKYFNFSQYPYLDTFKWLDTEKGIIYNYIPNEKKLSGELITLNDYTGGYFHGYYLSICDFSNVVCSYRDIVHLDYCDMDVYYKNVVFSKINNIHILIDHSIKKDGDYIFNIEYDHLNCDSKISKMYYNHLF